MLWDPTRDLLTMQERLESLFGRTSPGWVPAVDLHEVAASYILTIELPGLSREDVLVEFRDDALVVRGHRPACGCPDRFQHLERGQGAFSRLFRFSHAVHADAITAEIADGVLTVVVPKVESSSEQRIAIA